MNANQGRHGARTHRVASRRSTRVASPLRQALAVIALGASGAVLGACGGTAAAEPPCTERPCELAEAPPPAPAPPPREAPPFDEPSPPAPPAPPTSEPPPPSNDTAYTEPGSSCSLAATGPTVTISNERSAPIYLYPDGGCYDPLRTVLAVRRDSAWVDVFGTTCNGGPCESSVRQAPRGPDECTCPDIGMVRLDPGAKLRVGPLSTRFSRPLVGTDPAPGDALPGDAGAPASGTLECIAWQPLPAGLYELEVDAMSELDRTCGPDCDCTPGASGACVTRAQAGDGEVLTMTQSVQLPGCDLGFTFRE